MKDEMLVNESEIRDLRKLFNVSADNIARYIGCTRQTINNYEYGRCFMPKPIAICITLYFQKLNRERIFDDYKTSEYQKYLIEKVKSFVF